VHYFDYRWAVGTPDHAGATYHATVGETAAALTGYVNGLASSGRPVFLVGFSKGGVTVAEAVAEWDRTGFRAPGVSGAVILDAPMAGGPRGWLQSLGSRLGIVPNDGGYDPVDCVVGPLWCRDSRDGLGERSRVPVAVVRNPKAWITNFDDIPDGLRVYDAPDRGSGFLGTMLQRPWSLPSRVFAAHEAVLHDQDVADCIVAEMRTPGTCGLSRAGRPPGPAVWPFTGRLPMSPGGSMAI